MGPDTSWLGDLQQVKSLSPESPRESRLHLAGGQWKREYGRQGTSRVSDALSIPCCLAFTERAATDTSVLPLPLDRVEASLLPLFILFICIKWG